MVPIDANAGAYCNHGSSATLDNIPSTYGAMTICTWLYRDSNGPNQEVVTKDNSFPSGYDFVVDDGGVGADGQYRWAMFRATTNTDVFTPAGYSPLNAWAFVAGVYDENASQRVRLYAGNLSGAATETVYDSVTNGSGAFASDAAANLYIGSLQRSPTLTFQGYIARAHIYGAALTPEEIRFVQRAAIRDTVARNCLLAVEYRGGDSAQYDWSGQGNHGVMASSAVGALQFPEAYFYPPLRGGQRGLKIPLAALTLVADPGTYTYTGATTSLLWARTLAADPGSYVVTGTAADLLHGRVVLADPGVYALTGVDAGLLRTYLLEGAPGSYALTGVDAALLRGYLLVTAAGTYSVIGVDATLDVEIPGTIVAEPGVYAVTGYGATLQVTRVGSLGADGQITLGNKGSWGTPPGTLGGSW